MKFKEWLNILEASSGRKRSGSADVSNIAIGKIGPYGTFGGKDAPGLAQTAVGHVVGGLSSSLKDELGPIETFPHILPLDIGFNETKDGYMADARIPLQVPSINGQLWMNTRLADRTRQKANIEKIRKIMPDPENDQRVRKDFSQVSGGFDLYTENLEGKIKIASSSYEDFSGNSSSVLFLAERFSTALAAIMVSNVMMKEKNYMYLKNKYDVEFPIVLKEATVPSGDYYYLRLTFICKNKKTSSEDDDIRGNL
jgi:hypothetical protein